MERPPSAVELRAGAASVTGRVHEELGDGNEDGYLLDRRNFVFALYDTHGPKAPAVLRTISETIPPSFADFLTRPPPLKEEALRADASLIERNLSDGSGSTLSLVHFSSPSAFWLLHIGDCMVIKGRERPPPPSAASPNKRKQPDAAALEAVLLTPLHRISNPAELTRVQATGGTVDDKYVVHPSDPEKVIALTRTLGDTDMRAPNVGVVAVPEPVQLCRLDPEDRFLVIVSDGVHEHATPQQIVDRILQCTQKCTSAKQVAMEFLETLERDVLLDDDATIVVILIESLPRSL